MDLVVGLQIVVAESKVQGELGAYLPVVLYIRRHGSVSRSDVLDRLGTAGIVVNGAVQEAGIGFACTQTVIAESQATAEASVGPSVGLQPLRLGAEDEVMAVLDPVQVVQDGEGIGGDGAGAVGRRPVAGRRTAAKGDDGHVGCGIAWRRIGDADGASVFTAVAPCNGRHGIRDGWVRSEGGRYSGIRIRHALAGGYGEPFTPVAGESVFDRVEQGLRENGGEGQYPAGRLLVGIRSRGIGRGELGVAAIVRRSAVADIAAEGCERERVA